jgi:hypothetical protein
MTWRGSTSWKDRTLACLVYLVPLLEVLPFGFYLFGIFPPLLLLYSPLLLIAPVYFYSVGGLQLISLAIFFGLYIGVVRNESLPHFLRFNTMQALLLAIIIFLCALVLDLLGMGARLAPAGAEIPISPLTILQNTLFLAILAASAYAIARCIQGVYAEIPVISEAAYTQTRY